MCFARFLILSRQITFFLFVWCCVTHHFSGSGAFAEDPAFIFVAFQILQLRNVCWATKGLTTKSSFFKFSKVVDSIKPGDIKEALSGLNRKSTSFTLDPTNPKVAAINDFVGQIKIAGGNVAGSDLEKPKFRRRILGLMVAFNLPLWFATVNPQDLHHPLFSLLSGMIGQITDQVVNKDQRAAAVARNPVAASRFFATIIDLYVRHLLNGGIYGKLAGHWGTVENFGRGSHHLHLLLFVIGVPDLARFVANLYSAITTNLDND